MRVKSLPLIDLILKTENKSLTVLKDFLLVFSFAFLTGVCAKLKIEIFPVPITMQTLTVLLSGALLGKVKGALSQLTYLIFGLAGIPWFARGGGIAYLMNPSFGYILGFILCAYFVGLFCERGWDREIQTTILAMIIGNAILYLPGLLWLGRFIGKEKVLVVGLYPFLLGDFLKILLAASIANTLRRIVK